MTCMGVGNVKIKKISFVSCGGTHPQQFLGKAPQGWSPVGARFFPWMKPAVGWAVGAASGALSVGQGLSAVPVLCPFSDQTQVN